MLGIVLMTVLSGCTGIGDPAQTKACRALADQVPHLTGVSQATYTLAYDGGIPVCTGDVTLGPSLTTTQRGQVVGEAYDVVRGTGLNAVRFSTTFTTGPETLHVTSGFPTGDQATKLLDLAEGARSQDAEIATSPSGLWATVHAPLTSTAPAQSLREGIALLRLAPPTGFAGLDWRLDDTRIVAATINSDEATHLDALASWFESNPVVVSYSLTVDAGVQSWSLVTTSEVPDRVREFAAQAGGSATVSASLAGKTPYITLP